MSYSAKTSLRSGRVKLAMGGRQFARLMEAVSRMVSRSGGAAPEALAALRKGGAVPTELTEAAGKLRAQLASGGTGAQWRELASRVGNETALRDGTFRLIPRVNTGVYDPSEGLRGGRFEQFLQNAKNRQLSAHGWGPNGFVTSEAVMSGKAAPVPPGWSPIERAYMSRAPDVMRGEFLRLNPGKRFTNRAQQDLGTVLQVPKKGMVLPPGGKGGGIPFADEINPANELDFVGAGRGAYLFRGGGINAAPSDHVFLSGNAAVAKHYSSGVAGMQAQRNNASRIAGNDNSWSGVPRARPDTQLPTPRLLQWFPSTVARTPQGQQLSTRPHGVGIHGTKGTPYEEVVDMSRNSGRYSSGNSMDNLQSYQVDFPAANLGPQQSRVPRGFNHVLGREQVDQFGLRPYQNATGWAYDTPQGTYVMRGREAFEKDFHTRDGRAAMRVSGQKPPRNQPLPLPLHDPNAKPLK